MDNNYIDILENSLAEKIKVLDEIMALSQKQGDALSKPDFKIEDFDIFIEEKGKLIEKLEKLDAGFETLYSRVSEEIKGNREKYAAKIKNMQNMINQITEKSSAIQVLEKRNQNVVNIYLRKKKAEIKEGRVNSKVAMNYYNAQRNTGLDDSLYMDSKN
ncbi:MAG: flagellar protein FliT [Lachnospiraceae bacterium]|nr:flagellar protein FliT [Lachnospiraceae bacterium]